MTESPQVTPRDLTDRAAPQGGAERPGPAARRCLITNDDGIASEGLRLLALVAAEAGLDVTVAAPLRDVSGASASITAVESDGRFVVERRPLRGLDGVPAFGVQGLPAFIALVGARGAFGAPPDIVLSGINNGPNTGHAILHSGTVGAALTASTHGCRAMAVSLNTRSGQPEQWGSAVAVARRVLPLVAGAEPGTVLNLNVPNLPLGELQGLRGAPLAGFGAVQFSVAERGEGYVQMSLSEIDTEQEPGSDAGLLAAGFCTLTPLRPVCEAGGPRLDLDALNDSLLGDSGGLVRQA